MTAALTSFALVTALHELITVHTAGLQILATTSSIILMNLTAPPENIGAINGAGQTLASFGRAAGPAVGGVTWALTVQTGLHGHQYLAFAFIGACAMLGQLLYIWVKVPES